MSVSDIETDYAVQRLHSMGVNAGPCGAATLAALSSIGRNGMANLGLNLNSVVVLFCTEGMRNYDAPGSIGITNSARLTQNP
jgi:diaminopropionate ammonia-lyase